MSGSGPAVGRWGILALIMAAQTFANVGPLGIPSIAPLIRDDLALSVAEAGSFISAYYIGPSLMSLPAGWMADRWGVLPSMVLGQVLIAVGLVAVGGSHAFPLMAACMVVSGAGYGILNPTTTKAGMAWFPPRQRATVVGLKQVGLPLGGALGALIMPPLALAFGWRTAVVLPRGTGGRACPRELAALSRASRCTPAWRLGRAPLAADDPRPSRSLAGRLLHPRLRGLADGVDGLPRPVPD